MTNTKPVLAVMIGISGSGKSTYANGLKTSLKIENGLDTKLIETDAIRGELSGNEADQSKNNEVFSIARRRVESGLRQGNNVIIDATSTKPRDRRTWVDIGKSAGAEVRAYFVNTPIDVAKKRNLARTRNVPDHVIDRQFAALTPPKESEGFDVVKVV